MKKNFGDLFGDVERLADLRTGSARVFILANTGDNYKQGNRMPKREAAPPASKVRAELF
jgi:hypothetical protein